LTIRVRFGKLEAGLLRARGAGGNFSLLLNQLVTDPAPGARGSPGSQDSPLPS
jgi:hypothetical protein